MNNLDVSVGSGRIDIADLTGSATKNYDPTAGWTTHRLADLVSIPNGQIDPRLDPYSEMTLIAPDHVEARTGKLLSRVDARTQNAISGKYLVEPGDVVYSKIRPYLRKAILADTESICSADMYPLRAKAAINPRFLLAVILGEGFSRFAEAVSMRTGIPKLNRDEFNEFFLSVPTRAEQNAIAAILEAFDREISITESILSKLLLSGSGMMEDLLRRESNRVWDARRAPALPVRMIPAFDDSSTLALGQVVNDLRYGTSMPSDDNRTGIPVLRIPNVQAGSLDLTDLQYQQASAAERQRFGVAANDLLVIRTNGNPRLLGRCARVEPGLGDFLFASYLIRVRVDARRVSPPFAAYYLNSRTAHSYIESIATTSAGNYNVNTAQLRAMPFPSLTLDRQEAIVERLQARDRLIAAESRRLGKLLSVKNSLSFDLLSGRVRVPIEAAS